MEIMLSHAINFVWISLSGQKSNVEVRFIKSWFLGLVNDVADPYKELIYIPKYVHKMATYAVKCLELLWAGTTEIVSCF